LTITVETDGTVTPEDAVIEAATLLRNFFSRFARGPDPEELLEAEEAQEKEDIAQKEDVFLEDLHLPTRTINALKKHGVETLNQLAKLSDDELADVKNLGEKSIKEIRKILKKEGLRE
jgi:DNA-directed RNA polymerase subunit alpha